MKNSQKNKNTLFKIALNIGNDLNIHQLLSKSIKVFVKELKCSGGLFILDEASGLSSLDNGQAYYFPREMISNQAYKRATQVFNALKGDLLQPYQRMPIEKKDATSNYYYYQVRGFGFLCLVKENEGFTKSFQRSLIPLVNKLAQSVKISLANEKIKEKYQKYKFITENSPNAIFILDNQYRFLYANKKFFSLLGSPSLPNAENDFRQFLNKKDRDWITNRYRLRQQGCKVPSTYMIDVTNQKNEKKYLEVNAAILKPSTNIHSLVHIQDVTQRKKIELKLIKSEERLRKFMDAAPASVILLDYNLRIMEVNAQVTKIFGGNKKDVIGQSIIDFILDIKKMGILQNIIEVINTGKSVYIDDLILPQVNERRFTATIFKFKEGLGIILLDITKRKKMEEKLKSAINSKSKLFSMISHELRTPLTTIKEGLAIVLDGSAGEISNMQKNFLEMTKRNVDRLHRLINEVLDFSKIESGNIQFNFKEHNLGQIIREIVFTHQSLVIEKNISLRSRIKLPPKLLVFDADRITQVLMNLTNNSLRLTNKGGIIISAEKEKDKIIVCVEDSGIGVKKEDQAKLFKIYGQVGSDKYRATGTTGLGLIICKEIVKAHGGEIWVESKYSVGTKIFFTLPDKSN
ncbi:ATP-binding protein [Candidatus Margulisiibacteriota bacterium]